MTLRILHHLAHHHSALHVHVVGPRISDVSTHLLQQIAAEAHVAVVHVTSVHRSVKDQARIFFDKHVVEGKQAIYHNREVAKIVAHARKLHQQGASPAYVKAYLIHAIEHVHGGPRSISAHLGEHLFREVFDVAHYSGPTTGRGRRDSMTKQQATAFLAACRQRMPFPIARLGHSAELGFVAKTEFKDEKCFHFEVIHVMYDRLERPTGTMYA